MISSYADRYYESIVDRFADLGLKEKVKCAAEARFDQHEQESALNNILFKFCSWNFDPGSSLDADRKRECLLRTLDLILPSVVLLQEHVWVYRNVQGHMLNVEPDNLYAIVAHRWQVSGIPGHKNAAILYDPQRIIVHELNEQISRHWRNLVATMRSPLGERTIALTASVQNVPPVQNFEGINDFIFISVHMYGSRSGYTEAQRLQFSNDILAMADYVCQLYNKFVLIGADWNCPVNRLQLPLRSIMCVPADNNNQFEEGGVDSVILFSPNHQRRRLIQNFHFFYWENGDVNGRNYNHIYAQGGKHRPLVGQFSY